MILGNFTYDRTQDSYTGAIGTLTTSHASVTFRPTGKNDGKAPEYRIEAKTKSATIELGAAWKRTGENGEYLSVKLDDPTLQLPIRGALTGGEGGNFILVWTRDNGSRKKAA
jgi:uncharacterized protein (DUF736 family)